MRGAASHAVDEKQARALREAAIARAEIHRPMVEMNSALLAEAAQKLVTLDSDPRSYEAWLAQLRHSNRESQ
jgi:hypothetical protein